MSCRPQATHCTRSHRRGDVPPALLAVLVLGACSSPTRPSDVYLGPPGTSETHVVVELRRGTFQGEAWRIRSVVTVEDATREMLLPEEPPAEPLALPTTYTIVARDRSGVLDVQVDVLDQAGFTVGRARGGVELVTHQRVQLVLSLTPACSTPRDCQDGVFCNGEEVCEDGMCGPGRVACPPSPFSCVLTQCEESARACNVDVDHAACAGVDGGAATYCDPRQGCREGLPGAPALEGDATVAPAVGRVGTQFRLEFNVSEPLQTDPAVQVDVGSRRASFLLDPEGTSRESRRYVFTYTADGSEVAGRRPITVDLVDRSGTSADGLAGGAITLDFQAPRVSSHSVQPRFLRQGATATLDLVLSEDVLEPPVVRMRPQGADGGVTGVTWTADSLPVPRASWTFHDTATGLEVPGAQELWVSAVDTAGNLLDPTLLETLTLDFLAPTVSHVAVDPELARPGLVVTVTVLLSEPTLSIPTLTAVSEEGTALEFSLDSIGATALGYSHPVRHGEDGTYVLELPALEDAAGNRTPPSQVGSLRVDGTPPRVTRYEQSGAQLHAGDLLSVTVEMDEPLKQPPQLLLGPVVLSLVETLGDRGGRYQADLSAQALAGTYQVELTAEDLAGNVSFLRPGPPTSVDTVQPDLLDVTFSPPVARLNSTAVLTLTTTETLARPPVLHWDAQAGDPGFLFVSSTGLASSYALSVDDYVQPGLYTLLRADLEDLAGNTAAVVVDQRFTVAFTVDNLPPRIVNLHTDAARYSAQPGHNRIHLTMDVSESLDGPGAALQVSVGGEPMVCDRYQASVPNYACTADVVAGMSPGPVTVDVMGRDAAGNAGFASTSVTLDFQPPQVAFAAPLPTPARLGATVLYTVSANETLAQPPVLSVQGAQPLAFTYRAGSSYVFEHLATAQDLDGRYDVTLTLVDEVGNTAQDVVVPPVILDVHPPVVSELATERPRYRMGERVQATFNVTECLDGPEAFLEVALGSAAMTCGPCRATPPHYTCTALVQSPPLAEGPQLVSVTARDAAGNTAFASQAVVLDFQAPGVLPGSTVLTLTPPPGCMRSSVSAVTTGTQVRLSFSASEALDHPPELRLPSLDAASMAPELVAGQTFSYRWTYTGDATAPQGEHALLVDLQDTAGNTATVSLPVVLTVDTQAPVPLTAVQERTLLYRRTPWGSARTAGQPRFEVLSTGPGAVEPNSTLLIWDRPTVASALEIGRGTADAQGTLPTTGLNASDRGTVYVTQVDNACNTDGPTATLLHQVEWVATVNQRVPGSSVANPHRFEQRAWHTEGAGAVLPESVGVQEAAGTVLGLPDGNAATIAGAQLGYVLASTQVPVGLTGHRMVYDSLRQRTVLFGGCMGTPAYECPTALADTWELSAQGWNKVSPTDPESDGNPEARRNFGMTYDVRRGRVVMFGGGIGSGTNAETWEYDGVSWLHALPEDPEADGNPSGRSLTALAYDEQRGKTVLFGGCSNAADSLCWSGKLGDTWEWDGRSWKKVATDAQGPGARAVHDMAYDANRHVVVMTGGVMGATGSSAVADVWEWNGQAWTKKTDGTGVGRHRDHRLAWDPVRGAVVLFGGTDGGGTIQNGLWSWNGTAWNRITPTVGADGVPGARVYHAMTYDVARRQLVMFGGYDVSAAKLKDLWFFPGNTWQRGAPANPDLATPPVATWGGAVTYDSRRQVLVMFSGSDNSQPVATTWEWDGRQWKTITVVAGPSGLPNGRYSHVMGFDTLTQRTLLTGGMTGWSCDGGGMYCQRTWSYDGTTWTPLTGPGSGPPEVYQQAAAYDVPRQQWVAVTACFDGSGCNPGTWTWSSAAQAWTEHRASTYAGGHPPPLWQPAMGFDEARGVSVMALGDTGNAPVRPRPVYEFDGTAWHTITPAGTDPESIGGQFVYDAENSRLLLTTEGPEGDPREQRSHWTWDGTSWTRIPVAALPASRILSAYYPAVGFDLPRKQVVFFGGSDMTGRMFRETWLGLSGRAARPSGVLRVDLAGLNLTGATLQSVEAQVVAGGHGNGVKGAELLAWYGGEWHSVDATAADVDAPATLDWTESSPTTLPLLVSGNALYVAAIPAGSNGNASAVVAVDYAELKVGFRLP